MLFMFILNNLPYSDTILIFINDPYDAILSIDLQSDENVIRNQLRNANEWLDANEQGNNY